ncbi:MAG: type VI secretion system baseplate subunit TssE [Neisseriaceae bacterium]|nr:type VI secretion system baseplate subunit TssE [Neisseriaceae bacterium]
MRDRFRASADKLLPSLIDRLTDQLPHKKTEVDESRVMSLAKYRDAVLRDLLFLLNTANPVDKEHLTGFTQVQSSCVNYGIEPLSGANVSEIDWLSVEDNIRQAITHFEPRINPDSLLIKCLSEQDQASLYNALIVEIRGDLILNPYPQAFFIQTAMDVETGTFDLVLGGE